MVAGYTVIITDHRDSVTDEVIYDDGYLIQPTVDALTQTLKNTLVGSVRRLTNYASQQ